MSCILCGYHGQTHLVTANKDIKVCLLCYLKHYAEKPQGEDKMGWNEANKEKSAGGREDHFTVAPNTTKLIHILLTTNEEPHSYWTHYIPLGENKGRSVICPGRDTCPACASNKYKTSRRHAINVYDYEKKEVKIFEAGNTIVQQLSLIGDQFACKDKGWGDIDISIRRIGKGLETQYIVIPVPAKSKFDNTNLKLHDLINSKKPHTVDEINNIINGRNIAPISVNTPTQTTSTAGEVIAATWKITPAEEMGPEKAWDDEIEKKEGITLKFGKYQGKTLEEILAIDYSYVKWCSENINDPRVKEEAKRLIAKPAAVKEVAPKVDNDLINRIQIMFNNDPRYAGHFDVIVAKMKEASKSATHPNGKTLLGEYTPEELNNLAELLK